MKNRNYAATAAFLVALTSLAVAIPAFAESSSASVTTQSGNQGAGVGIGKGGMHGGFKGLGMMKPGVRGTVTAVNGNSITLTSKGFGPNATSTTYTVDTTNAKVTKTGVTTAGVSAIAVGDTIMVNGTVTGTSVAATTIRDVVGGMNNKVKMNQMPAIAGNGQPLVGGTVTSVTGGTIVITNKSNVTYTVDATNAQITKRGVTGATIGNVSVGDMLFVQGTVNGTAVVASAVMDQGIVAAPAVSASGAATAGGQQAHRGFLGSIGHFFGGLFGF